MTRQCERLEEPFERSKTDGGDERTFEKGKHQRAADLMDVELVFVELCLKLPQGRSLCKLCRDLDPADADGSCGIIHVAGHRVRRVKRDKEPDLLRHGS